MLGVMMEGAAPNFSRQPSGVGIARRSLVKTLSTGRRQQFLDALFGLCCLGLGFGDLRLGRLGSEYGLGCPAAHPLIGGSEGHTGCKVGALALDFLYDGAKFWGHGFSFAATTMCDLVH